MYFMYILFLNELFCLHTANGKHCKLITDQSHTSFFFIFCIISTRKTAQ